MLYIKLFIEREKNIGQSAPECPFNMLVLSVVMQNIAEWLALDKKHDHQRD